jgi:hypothetical protein
MNKNLLSRLSLVGGILVVLIAVVHTSVTPMVYRNLGPLGDKALGMAYMFGVMGIYVGFCGWLMIYSSRGLARGERWARTLALVNGALNGVLGVGAVAVGFRNPFVWAWLVIAAALAALAAVSRR